jgi:membrane protease YdiL (CAAX protease family)
MRLTTGHTPRFTAAVTAVSAVILIVLVVGIGACLGVLDVDPDSWGEDSRWFVLILAFVPGIWEELAFRGLMLANLQHRYSPWTAIVVSGTLFGLMHLTDLATHEASEVVFKVIMATTLGIAWGYLTVKTGSVAPAMILHYSVNALIDFLVEPELTDTASAAMFGSVTLAYPTLTIIAAWALARLMARRPDPSRGLVRQSR